MTTLRPTLAALGLVLALLSASAPAQLTTEAIDHLVEDAMRKFEVAGVAVAVVKDDAIVHAKGYGVRSIDAEGAVDKDTNFSIASNTKAFTTAALAILVDEGLISWQDKVRKHIPEFRMYDAYVTESFNIEDLLTHRSGLGLGVGDLMFIPDGSDFTMKDIIASFQHFEPVSAFRTKFDYDNLLYLVAGEVIARVSGMGWEDFVKQRILVPLGMNHTATGIDALAGAGNAATPHSTETGKIRTIANLRFDSEKLNDAAGGIYSNVDDLCCWMRLQLNEGRYGPGLEQRLFSEARQREMWMIHTSLPARRDPRYASHFRGYGLGWFLSDLNGTMSVTHTGGLPGMLSKTILIPDLELGIVVLTNTSNGGGGLFSAVSQTILDGYLGLDDFGWTDKQLARYEAATAAGDAVTAKVWETVEAAKHRPIDAAAFVGIYEDRWFGKVEVYTAGDQLMIRAHRSPKLRGPLRYYQANAFAVKWDYQDMNADAFAIFSLDQEGQAQSLELKGISPNIDFSFDFQDLDLKRIKPSK
ncbi:MAG: serine hydrolase [Planctomycetes bacterium]|nr:serine hydrolase [Planctomycetota bacterium]